jgi:hypothetical protein
VLPAAGERSDVGASLGPYVVFLGQPATLAADVVAQAATVSAGFELAARLESCQHEHRVHLPSSLVSTSFDEG